MACAKLCGNAEAYQHQHKAVVVDMCNQAQHVVNQHGCAQSVVTGGCIKNLANGESAKFLAMKDWAGRNKAPYPKNIAKLHAGTFVHKSDCKSSADKAAAVYSDNCGNAWLFAWSVIDHCSSGNMNKVYVEAGPAANYVGIDWDCIEEKLDNSCDTSYYVDEATGCEIFGKISRGKKAALVVSFHSY